MKKQNDIIQLTVEQGQLTLEQGGFLAAGSGGCWRAEFRFCGKQWEGMTKTAVFTQNVGGKRTTLHLLLDEENGCIVPAQVLQEPLPVYLGVFGIGGERLRMSTNFVRLEVLHGSFSQQLAPEPLPDVYQQVIAKLQEVIAGAQAVLQEAQQAAVKIGGRVDALLAEQPLGNFSELLDLRLGRDGTRYGAAGEAVRRQLEALDQEKLAKDAPGSVSYAMLSQEVREKLTGGSAAVVGKDGVLAENLADRAVTPAKTAFFRRVQGEIDPAVNLFGGEFRRFYLTGSTGGLTMTANENGKLAVVEVEPNTSYSISLNLRTTLKVGSSSRLLEAGEAIDGGINVTVGSTSNQTVRTTGAQDRYLYISVTNPSADHYDDSEIYLKVMASTKAVLPAEGEGYSAFRYVPTGVELYSREEVDRMLAAAARWNRITVRKRGQDLYIRVPCTSGGRYVCYYYKRVDSDRINMHQWRVQTTDIVDENWETLYALDSQTEWEGALREKNASDYIGGYHGDEVNAGLSVMLDGHEISMDGEDFERESREVRIVNHSRLCRADTPEHPLFDRVKEQLWSGGDYTVHNLWRALEQVEVQESKLCTISCRYTSVLGIPLVKYARKNDDFALQSLEEPFSGFGGQDITQMELWGEPEESGLYLSIRVEAKKYPHRRQFVTDFREQNRCKVYFDITGSYTMAAGEVLESTARMRVDC